MIAAVEQDASLALALALEKALHRARAAVEARSSPDIDQRDRVALADVGEEGLQVDLLDPHFAIVVAVVPKAHRIVLVMSAIADVVDPVLGECGRVRFIQLLDVLGGARL